MKKIIILMLMLSLIPLVSSATLGTVKQYDCIYLQQTCDNCTYINITSIRYPNTSIALANLSMTKDGNEYDYQFCGTNVTGNWNYKTCGDEDGTTTCETVDFGVTPTGFIGGFDGTLGFYLVIGLISFSIILLGFRMQDYFIIILGTLGLYFLGIYSFRNGIAGFRDNIFTYSFSVITLATAFYLSLRSALGVIKENF